jgi:3-deoxy-manno-octulosonate cytidylyltransferase (CMP-KDO synthetase)
VTLLAVIPARLGATRLPRKPLRLLGGAPLVVRVWERAMALDVADRCVVATDSEDVLAAVRDAGGEAVLTRGDHPSGTDRVAEVARHPEYRRYDVLVNIQGDEPFASAEVVRAAADEVASGRFPLGTVAAPDEPDVLGRPDVVKVVRADDGRALYFSRAGVPHLRDAADRAARDALVRRHIGIYAYTRDALERWVALAPHPLELIERLEQLRPLAHGIAMGVGLVDVAPPAGVDTEEDLVRANEEWSRRQLGRAAHDPSAARSSLTASAETTV